MAERLSAEVRTAALAQETCRRAADELRRIATALEPHDDQVAGELRALASYVGTDLRTQLRAATRRSLQS